jgi:hypothetical protein
MAVSRGQRSSVLLTALLDEAGSSSDIGEPYYVRSLILHADNQEAVVGRGGF